jgi:glycosyltransferase involved in cell wall biosynthesis
MKPTVSVIIPSYNYGHFLVRAIESVLAQTYQDFEIIVADDHSSDDTENIMEHYIKKHRGVRYIRQKENVGQSKNRNTAISMASGEFIALLDADDWLHPEYLATCMPKFKKKSVGVVYTANMFHYKDGSQLKPEQKIISGYIYNELYINNFIGTSVIFRKEAMPRHGYNEQLIPELNNMGVDWWILLEMSVKWEIVGIDKPLYNYLYHDGQISSKFHNRVMADTFIQWKFRTLYGCLLGDDVKKEALYWSAIRTGYYLRADGEKINACKAYADAVRIHPFSSLPYKGLFATIFPIGAA